MLATSTFYPKQVLKIIQPYIRKSEQLSPLSSFPLNLTQNIYQKSQIKFYKKYFIPNLHKHLFMSTFNILSQPPLQQSTQLIQPTLHKKIKSYLKSKSTYLKPTQINVLSSQILCITNFKGIFIHRNLNMPSQCYSIQQKKQDNIIYRMRNKFGKQQHMNLLTNKYQLYNRDDYKLEKFYMDGYHDFIKNQNVLRYLVEINVEIKGKLVVWQKQIQLPVDPQKTVTTHLLQIETIKVPTRSDIQTSLITDIDYYMQGNPYTI